MKNALSAALAAACLALPAAADGFYTLEIEGAYEDVIFNVELAITNQGLVIDDVSHVGSMLARTRDDVGSTRDLFSDARIFSFCSALLSRQVMEAQLRNIQFCPYNVYVYQAAEEGAPVVIGFREASEPTMAPVNELLLRIVTEAADAP